MSINRQQYFINENYFSLIKKEQNDPVDDDADIVTENFLASFTLIRSSVKQTKKLKYLCEEFKTNRNAELNICLYFGDVIL